MFNKENVKLGIAPIAWTNDDLPELGAENTFEQCISEMALAGFKGSEVGNKYPKDIKVLKKALDLRGIQICNAWFSTFFTTFQKEETIADFIKHRDFLNAMGAKVIGVSEQGHSIQGLDKAIMDEKHIFNDTEWEALAEGMNEIANLAEDLRDKGPNRGDWPNYSKLGPDQYHCHLSPGWVACWSCKRGSKTIEVYYAGSREDAPY